MSGCLGCDFGKYALYGVDPDLDVHGSTEEIE